MIDFLKSRQIDREKSDSLSEMEKIREFEKEKSINQRIETLIMKKFKEAGLEQRLREMDFKMDDVAQKIDEIAYFQQTNSRQNSSPSVRKMKVKEMITMLLKQHDSLSAPDLCRIMKLSRTRCTEYLKEMERRGILDSELKCRKKMYRIRQ